MFKFSSSGSNGKKKAKKIKKSNIKQKSDILTSISTTPKKRKSKPSSKPKSDALPKIKKKDKKIKKKSNKFISQYTTNNNIIDKPLKKRKPSKAHKNNTFDPISNDENTSKSKAKKPSKPSKLSSIKKRLMISKDSKSDKIHQNKVLPSSAKKIVKKQGKKKVSKMPQVHSMKKPKDFQYNFNYNMKASNPILARQTMTDMYGYGKNGKKQKKKPKKSDIEKQQKKPIKIKKKKKKESSRKRVAKKKKKTNELNKNQIHKLKKKAIEPAATEKLSMIRQKMKTKTKRKELYVIGDYIKLNEAKWGIIRYKGSLKNVTGIWYGIELMGKDKNGDCDGIFNEERYFKCNGYAGIFVMYSAIQCKLKNGKVDQLLNIDNNNNNKKNKNKNKNKRKRRSNTMAMAQSLSYNMDNVNIVDDGKKNKNKNKNKKKKGGNKKNNNNNKLLRTKSMTETPKNLNVKKLNNKQLSVTPNGLNEKRRFKFDIPSAKKSSSLISETSININIKNNNNNNNNNNNKKKRSLTTTEPVIFTLNGNNININKFAKYTGSTGKQSVHGKSSSNYQIQSVYRGERRGRKSGKTGDGHRRTRSLSSTREDDSWMKKRDDLETSSEERIKENIRQKKQLDLQSLIGTKSVISKKKKKKEIGQLFEKHIENAKVITAKGGNAECLEPNTAKLRERLKDEEDALLNAVDIVKDLGFLKYIKDNDIYSKIYIKSAPFKYNNSNYYNNDDDEKGECMDYDLFDMNNIDILSKFGGKTRDILSKVICKSIISIPSIEIVEICNCEIDANFMEILCLYLNDYYANNGNDARITILSLQSNPITDRGMIELSKLIRLNNSTLNTIKLQNNRRDISTLICQQICESLKENQYIIKFEFEFRHYQWRDYRDKVIKRNAENARKKRLELKKNISL